MGMLRAFMSDHRRIAAALIVLALAMKALLPGGYMPAGQGTVLTIAICAETQGARIVRQIVLPATGKQGAPVQDHGKSEGACPYAGMALAIPVTLDAALLALALAFILALGFAPRRAPRPRRTSYLRPPLRGPPSLA